MMEMIVIDQLGKNVILWIHSQKKEKTDRTGSTERNTALANMYVW
jgi:hypothetical protein